MFKRQKTYIFLFVISIYSCRQEVKQIVVVPGLGLIISNDTIKHARTREADIFRIFKLKNALSEISVGSGCGYDSEGNPESSDTYHRSIHCDGINFNYLSLISKDSLTLDEIEISDTTHWTVKVNDSIILGKNIPDILKYFPKRDSSDEYDNDSKNLHSYGINLGLEDNGRQKRLSYISIFKVTETE